MYSHMRTHTHTPSCKANFYSASCRGIEFVCLDLYGLTCICRYYYTNTFANVSYSSAQNQGFSWIALMRTHTFLYEIASFSISRIKNL